MDHESRRIKVTTPSNCLLMPKLTEYAGYYSGQPASHSRSMSGSSDPHLASRLAFSAIGTEVRKFARQRRQDSQEDRRQAKLRLRKSRLLPSILEPAPAPMVLDSSGSIDFCTAPSVPSSYVSSGRARSNSHQEQHSSYEGGLPTYDHFSLLVRPPC